MSYDTISEVTTGCKWLSPENEELLSEDDGFEDLTLEALCSWI